MNELIVRRAMKGDKESFTQAILEVKDQLYVISKARLKNEDDICDAIQETMLEAFKNIHKLKNAKYFKTWIIKILINKCNYIYKSKKKYSLSYENAIYEKGKQPEDLINQINSRMDFFILIDLLDYDEKLIFILYYYNEYTTKQISKILNIKEGTIRSKITRAKIKIKNRYGKEIEYNGLL